MSLGPVMTGIQGTALAPAERERLRHPLTGGVILFDRNYESVAQLAELCAEIHALRTPPLLVAVDQEGGRVQRFRGEFTELPAPARLGALYRTAPDRALHAAENVAWLMAAELRAVGVDFSFAPVLDLDRGISRVIGDRALGTDPDAVARLGQAWARGMRRAGMAVVGKHFPGHGGVAPDSHSERVVDRRGYVDLEVEDLVPFARLVRNGLEAVMASHVIYPRVDGSPAGYSRVWIERVLREGLGFQGVVFSDDLEMEGAAQVGDMPERAAAAVGAGCDMVIVSNSPRATDSVLDSKLAAGPASALRLARLHGRGGRSWRSLRADTEWRQAEQTAGMLREGSLPSVDG